MHQDASMRFGSVQFAISPFSLARLAFSRMTMRFGSVQFAIPYLSLARLASNLLARSLRRIPPRIFASVNDSEGHVVIRSFRFKEESVPTSPTAPRSHQAMPKVVTYEGENYWAGSSDEETDPEEADQESFPEWLRWRRRKDGVVEVDDGFSDGSVAEEEEEAEDDDPGLLDESGRPRSEEELRSRHIAELQKRELLSQPVRQQLLGAHQGREKMILEKDLLDLDENQYLLALQELRFQAIQKQELVDDQVRRAAVREQQVLLWQEKNQVSWDQRMPGVHEVSHKRHACEYEARDQAIREQQVLRRRTHEGVVIPRRELSAVEKFDQHQLELRRTFQIQAESRRVQQERKAMELSQERERQTQKKLRKEKEAEDDFRQRREERLKWYQDRREI